MATWIHGLQFDDKKTTSRRITAGTYSGIAVNIGACETCRILVKDNIYTWINLRMKICQWLFDSSTSSFLVVLFSVRDDGKKSSWLNSSDTERESNGYILCICNLYCKKAVDSPIGSHKICVLRDRLIKSYVWL